ncbi:MAG: phosphoenolpyruvate--protein phosphotransferase [Nocardioidaceae bacterium]
MPPSPSPPDSAPAAPAASRATPRHGTPVVPGVATGPVVRPQPRVDLSALTGIGAADADTESQRYAAAVEAVADRLTARAAAASGVAAEVLVAQVGLVSDPGLRKAAAKQIASGSSAEAAVSAAVDSFAAMFEQVGGMMAERVTDLRDLGGRIVAELQGLPEPGIAVPQVPSVLMADDLAPADTAGLDPSAFVALVTSLGGPTSHTAIIARQLGIPCVVAADVDDIPVGTRVLVDGTTGEVLVEPDPELAAERLAADRRTRAAAQEWSGPGRTSDGAEVALYANVQDGATARSAAAGPSEGVGLFRSELAFLGQDEEPSVEAQAAIYAEVLEAYGDRRVVVRTLDAGSDKPMAFANLPDEENPALGLRGLRIAWANPGLLTRQLDAIALAAERTATAPWVMAPMVATAAEAQGFAEQVRRRGLTPGVMVEVPATALLAGRVLASVDFLSIGTNDLSQYTMAADRLSGGLAGLTDPWQPAVLHLVALTAGAGKAAGKPVGVCGEAAADPLLACVLVGLGVTSLSMAASAIGQVGSSVARASLEACQDAAAAALAAADPAEGRAAAAAALGR